MQIFDAILPPSLGNVAGEPEQGEEDPRLGQLTGGERDRLDGGFFLPRLPQIRLRRGSGVAVAGGGQGLEFDGRTVRVTL